MKKWKNIFLVSTLVLILCGCSFLKKDEVPTETDNTTVVTDDKIRSATIINKTDQIINELQILVGEGTEITTSKNLEEKTMSYEFPEKYDKYTEFTFILIDRYGLKYEKKEKINLKGQTEVVITEDDYVEQKGDFWKKVEKAFNGD